YKDELEFTQTISLPGGETVKNDSHYIDEVLGAINKYKICKHSYVIALGGGALIDLAGYAASIAHRGVRLIRIPTTVLSQNDAAVGVKNGVNIFGKKNFIGTFEPPQAVINDSQFLSTLEDRDWIAGIAEAVKVALIKDKDFLYYIKNHVEELRARNMKIMSSLIYRCAELHMQHIAEGGDPFEKGSSRPLDFGHWSAHKLENMTNYGIRHGEAVAKGMALDLIYASEIGLLPSERAFEIIDMLQEIGFDLHIPVANETQVENLLQGIEEFREHLGGQLTITLIEAIGRKKDVHEIDLNIMKKSISILNAKVKLNPA
ncbi:MAG: 3-dehydroquinate synthase, partial [Flavobacteriaceae bacterium]